MSNIIINNKEYSNVPSVTFNKVGGGTATYTEGGGGVIAQPITITVNGVYTAPEDTAYTPVTVNVPSGTPTLQSKTVNPSTSQQTVSPDTGYDGLSSVTVNPIPSQYIVPTGTISITSNGTVDVTQYASASVNVSNWTLLGSTEITLNTTSTSNQTVATIDIGSAAITKDNVIWVRVRDKAGARAGYFFGTDAMFFNANAANNVSSAYNVRGINIIRYDSSSQFVCYVGAYGIFGQSISAVGKIPIYARYNSTYTLTINGTYSIEVYALSLPTGKTIF